MVHCLECPKNKVVFDFLDIRAHQHFRPGVRLAVSVLDVMQNYTGMALM